MTRPGVTINRYATWLKGRVARRRSDHPCGRASFVFEPSPRAPHLQLVLTLNRGDVLRVERREVLPDDSR